MTRWCKAPLLGLLVVAALANAAPPAQFSSDFECGEQALASDKAQRSRLAASDGRLCAGKDWTRDLPGSVLGRASLAFESGDDGQRFAKVIPEPGQPGNHVLQFWLGAANVEGRDPRQSKGRVQLDINGNRSLRELRQSVRMRLPADFQFVRSYPREIGWLTVSEWWNNTPAPGERYPFRITVDVVKPDARAGSALYLGLRAETLTPGSGKWKTLWQVANRDFELPVDRWLTLNYQYREGDAQTGRFALAVVPEDGVARSLFDVTNFTHHPDDSAPNGLSHFNPLKLYTSAAVIEHVRRAGGALQILWDDFKLCAGDGETPLGADCAVPAASASPSRTK